jgi:hypothetical protein
MMMRTKRKKAPFLSANTRRWVVTEEGGVKGGRKGNPERL